jgi:hypothetical protein
MAEIGMNFNRAGDGFAREAFMAWQPFRFFIDGLRI